MRTKDIATVVVSVTVMALIILYLGPEDLLNKITKISIEVLFLLVILYFLDIGTRVLRLHVLTSSLGYDVGWLPLFYAQVAALFINICTPARAGELVRLHVLHEEYGISYAEGLAAIVVEHVLDIMALLTLAACSFLYVKREYTINKDIENLLLIGVIAIALFNACLIFTAVWGDRLIPLFRYFGPLEDKLLAFYISFQQGLAALKESGTKKLLLCVLLSFFVWFFESLIIYFLANDLAGGSDVSLVLAILASVIGNLTFIFPILPGSIGTYEVAIALIFGLVELEEKTGILIATVDRLFKVGFLVLVGGYASAKLGVDFAFRTKMGSEKYNDEQESNVDNSEQAITTFETTDELTK